MTEFGFCPVPQVPSRGTASTGEFQGKNGKSRKIDGAHFVTGLLIHQQMISQETRPRITEARSSALLFGMSTSVFPSTGL